MVKFLTKEYPKGTFKNQKTDGAYIDGLLASNLDTYAEKIVKDMHFLIIISGNDSVGNGKTTIATHIGTYLTNKINQLHGTNNTFTSENVGLKAKDLVDLSFKNPQYSVNLLDEGDDLTTHGMKQAAVELKRYFRKCRQLNQVLILIIPSFFELPKFYALARSHCLINVKFHGNFDRGVFDFYGPSNKKKLYLKGKRDWDYSVANPNFQGRFFADYCFFPDVKGETELYKKKKYKDMVDDADENKPKCERTIEKEIKQQYFLRLYNYFKKRITIEELADAYGVSRRQANTWLHDEREKNEKLEIRELGGGNNFVNNLTDEGQFVTTLQQ